jgi:periplasmic divalent cation tolerance protein
MGAMSDVVMALTTLPKDFDARSLAEDIVGSGLGACVAVLPGIRSYYTWKGVPQADEEQQVLIKTTVDQVDPLWDLLSERHPYETPEFLVIPVIDGSEAYLKWVGQSVGPKAES